MAEGSARKTAVVYCRVSSARQRDDETIAAQRERNAAIVARHDLDLVPYGPKGDGWIEDDGVSGTLLAGRAFAGLIEDLRRKRLKIDRLVVYSMSRISRTDTTSDDDEKQITSAQDAATISAVLRTRGVKILDETGEKDPTNVLAMAVEMAVGDAQHATIMRSTKSGKISRLERGQAAFGGKEPYGYTRELANGQNRKDGWKLVPDPVEVERLRNILTWYADGGSSYAVQEATLSEYPIPYKQRRKNSGADWTPTRWVRTTVHKMAARVETYRTGLVEGEYQGQPYSIQAEPLIDRALAMRVEARNKGGTLKKPATNLATGHLVCEVCKGTQGKGGARYSQGTVNLFVRCDRCKRQVYARDFDRRLRVALEERLVQIAIHTRQQEERDDHEARIEDVDRRLEAVRARLLKNADALDGGLPRDLWKERNAALVAERQALRAEREDIQATRKAAQDRAVQEAGIVDRVEQIIDDLLSPDLVKHRKALAEVLDGERISITWERDDEGKSYAVCTLPPWGGLPAATYRTDRRVSILTDADRASPHWTKIVNTTIQHGFLDTLERAGMLQK